MARQGPCGIAPLAIVAHDGLTPPRERKLNQKRWSKPNQNKTKIQTKHVCTRDMWQGPMRCACAQGLSFCGSSYSPIEFTHALQTQAC